uniref:SFRICE_003448 n=1 Tax=Spodoptera frugiperda TaxID=7108 RepID=A0A2H1VEN3_SPOFR
MAGHNEDSNKNKMCINTIAKFILIVLISVKQVQCSEDDEIAKRMKIIESVSGRYFSDVYQNGTFRTGNVLWDDILNKCTVTPSVSCLQKNVYTYLDDRLGMNGDVEVASGVCFKKNNVDINKYSKEANTIYLTGTDSAEEKARYMEEENEVDDEEPDSPFEEITDALYDKSVKFLVTHDMKLTLPEMFFKGATLRVSPRALTKTGALVHIDLEPQESNGEGRLFFKKIKKYIKKKLITAAIAIILVIKLIALKLVFVLPLIMGVTTAKKMFLKLLLFIFPALSHIFKLCSWYHQNYHTTKYHHHHHLITHHHKGPHHQPYGGHASHPSTIVVRPHSAGPPPVSEHFESENWPLSGAPLGTDYIIGDIHRNAISNFKPTLNDANDINAWGLGMPPGPSNVGEVAVSSNIAQNVAASASIPQRVVVANTGRPVGPPNPYYRATKKVTPKDPLLAEKEALIRAASIAARAPPSPVRDEILRVSAVKLKETNRIKAETELVKQQQQILAAQDPETIAAEKFYGALVDNVDALLGQMGATDLGCRERAVCSLYGDPFKHTPYSNLVSGHLSKDSSELVPAGDSMMAINYYRYVQAARDGQEQKDCLVSYPNCDIDFNKNGK